MTRIEDLLRESLQQTPTPDPAGYPGAAVRRRVGRARTRLAVSAGLAVAAVVAAVAVPLAMTGGSGGRHLQPGKSPTPKSSATAGARPTLWRQRGAHGVSCIDLRGRCTVVTEDSSGARHLIELKLDGTQLHSFPVPAAASFVADQNGSAWVWGGGDGAFPTAELTHVDTLSGQESTRSLGRTGNIRDLVQGERGDAWAVLTNAVDHFALAGNRIQLLAHIPIAGAQRIVRSSNGNGHLWVQAGSRLVELRPRGSGARRAVDIHWSGRLVADAGADRLWVQTNRTQIATLDPVLHSLGVGGSVGPAVDLPAQPAAVVPDAAGGIYVALSGGGAVHYDAAAIRAAGAPTARLGAAAGEAETISLALDGGVVMQTYAGTLIHWNPAGR